MTMAMRPGTAKAWANFRCAARYYNSEEGQGKWNDDGWFGTGDVVTIDPEGYVKITYRAKDLIKSGGE